jgi:hypothetical protein
MSPNLFDASSSIGGDEESEAPLVSVWHFRFHKALRTRYCGAG